MSRSFQPQVATSNHLIHGGVIYYTRSGWTSALHEAAVAHSETEAQSLLTQANGYAHETVGAVLMDVDLSTGKPTPNHLREELRTKGPSNYFHGKQALNV